MKKLCVDSSESNVSQASSDNDEIQVFEGEWDEEGVYFYQAFNDDIANWALDNQVFGGPYFKPGRMTWIKPSFAWVLYRSGYGTKHNQNRILKVKLSHSAVAAILSQCQCGHGGGGKLGRVQWDPARDIMLSADKKVPRKMLRMRTIQIGVKGRLSKFYVSSVLAIQDVTELSAKVMNAHQLNKTEAKVAMAVLVDQLPVERPYMPRCDVETLVGLGMLPGETSHAVSLLGMGKAQQGQKK
eukprot:GHVN01053932.1.p1 GENE.GHVN01053932.1~~GHVN01053932.1.p1  ORF type:complete len:241 (+),score=33.79 GHVN01053932.1:448-1170(+)